MATRADVDTYIPDGSDVAKADLRALFKEGITDSIVDVASASTVDLGAEPSINIRITGTATITSFGTAPSGTWRRLVFADAAVLTHNATSLQVPGEANITAVGGDRCLVMSRGSGNWAVLNYVGATKAQAQTIIGGTSVGRSVFTAASAAAARSAISAPAVPIDTSGVGQWGYIGTANPGDDLVLGAGGTWAWFSISITNSTSTYAGGDGGVDAGGTTIRAGSAGVHHVALVWRIA